MLLPTRVLSKALRRKLTGDSCSASADVSYVCPWGSEKPSVPSSLQGLTFHIFTWLGTLVELSVILKMCPQSWASHFKHDPTSVCVCSITLGFNRVSSTGPVARPLSHSLSNPRTTAATCTEFGTTESSNFSSYKIFVKTHYHAFLENMFKRRISLRLLLK